MTAFYKCLIYFTYKICFLKLYRFPLNINKLKNMVYYSNVYIYIKINKKCIHTTVILQIKYYMSLKIHIVKLEWMNVSK